MADGKLLKLKTTRQMEVRSLINESVVVYYSHKDRVYGERGLLILYLF